MDNLCFADLFEKLRDSDETCEIEAKRAEDVGKSILETVSALANEPGRGGGYLLLGVQASLETDPPSYTVVGVPDPDRLQADLASRCREALSTPVRPQMMAEQYAGKRVVVVYVPESQPHEKPVYIKNKGLPNGAFRRIGSTDQSCMDEDVAMFYQSRTHQTFDDTVIVESGVDDLDPEAIGLYRRLRADVNPQAAELRFEDQDLLYALGAMSLAQNGIHLTVSGLIRNPESVGSVGKTG